MDFKTFFEVFSMLAFFPAACMRFMISKKSSTEQLLEDARNGKLANYNRAVILMHTTTIGEEQTASILNGKGLKPDFIRVQMLQMNPIAEMNRMSPLLTPLFGLAYGGLIYSWRRSTKNWWFMLPLIALNFTQLAVYIRSGGVVYYPLQTFDVKNKE